MTYESMGSEGRMRMGMESVFILPPSPHPSPSLHPYLIPHPGPSAVSPLYPKVSSMDDEKALWSIPIQWIGGRPSLLPALSEKQIRWKECKWERGSLTNKCDAINGNPSN